MLDGSYVIVGYGQLVNDVTLKVTTVPGPPAYAGPKDMEPEPL